MELDMSTMTPEKAAMLLALTGTREEEDHLRRQLERGGHYKCAVTELGAKVNQFRDKVISSAVGASLNCAVISKTPYYIHALIHAVREATNGFIPPDSLSGDVAAKIAIVRDSQWIAVAMFGESADHAMADHKRAGLGVMHISF